MQGLTQHQQLYYPQKGGDIVELTKQNFGIEIEMTGITREQAAQTIAEFLHTSAYHKGGRYDMYGIKDASSREWKIVSDSSITAQRKNGNRTEMADGHYRVEFVSPICTYEDIPVIQEMVRALRQKGAFTNRSAGVHIHVGAEKFESNQLRNLVNIMASKEDMIYKALQVDRRRESVYCKKVDEKFLSEINRLKPKTREDLQNIWYEGDDGSDIHYHDSRYHCLNLHSVFQKNTIEFRAFNSNLHAGKIKAYLQFCLAITAQAYNQKYASPTKTVSENEKYTFRVWLLRLGMIGDEFKTARTHLLNNLQGNSAWKSPEQAEAQKERLRAKLEKEKLEENKIDVIDEQEQQTAPVFSMTMRGM